MIAQPEWIDEELVGTHISIVEKKKKIRLEQLRFEEFHEGDTAQIMHIGPFSEEGPTIQKLHDFIRSMDGVRTGLHHEVYLSDIRRAKPENWKTIIRQPFQK
ncbi:GyrI-like domain-containing protein [Pseudodesulfovibrio sediminis]|uniref:GyrI-like small molecule binding domain-containing protein n=1 Tax=Pseudodesulfovibrio sediminis TaxID=2810563 RepID=A0ABN6EUH7_9BACT|nr:hypothetical protein PSDVSF_20030 [Pseudodesulfovibrio sediminis]